MRAFSVFAAVLFIMSLSCQQQSTLPSDTQKAEIEKSVLKQYNAALSSVRNLDLDGWMSHFSTANFVGHIANGSLILSRDEYLAWVKSGWQLLDKFEIEQTYAKAHILSASIAMVVATSDCRTTSKDNTVTRVRHAISLTFEKEAAGWKIIQIHESFVAVE